MGKRTAIFGQHQINKNQNPKSYIVECRPLEELSGNSLAVALLESEGQVLKKSRIEVILGLIVVEPIHRWEISSNLSAKILLAGR